MHGEGGACMVKGGIHGKGGHAWQRGAACMAKGGMHGEWGVCHEGGMHGEGGAYMAKEGMHGKGGMCGRGEGGGHVWQESHCSGRYASYWNAFLLCVISVISMLELMHYISSIHIASVAFMPNGSIYADNNQTKI